MIAPLSSALNQPLPRSCPLLLSYNGRLFLFLSTTGSCRCCFTTLTELSSPTATGFGQG